MLSQSFYVLCQHIRWLCQALQLKVSKIESLPLLLWSTVYITHHNLLKIKLYLHLPKYMYYGFNFISLADYIDLTDDTCSREFLFWIADLQLCMVTLQQQSHTNSHPCADIY